MLTEICLQAGSQLQSAEEAPCAAGQGRQMLGLMAEDSDAHAFKYKDS